MDEPLVPRAPRNDRPIRGEDLYGPLRETRPEKTNGDPSGILTRVAGLKGRCPGPDWTMGSNISSCSSPRQGTEAPRGRSLETPFLYRFLAGPSTSKPPPLRPPSWAEADQNGPENGEDRSGGNPPCNFLHLPEQNKRKHDRNERRDLDERNHPEHLPPFKGARV